MTGAAHSAHFPLDPWRSPPGWARRCAGTLFTPDQTAQLASRLAEVLGAGDTLLLSGGLGAGKTHFARAFIRHTLGAEGAHVDIPSPTFTLVQIYETPTLEIWHADLYRLTSPEETVELGLEAAMDEALCLVEWPERLAPYWPSGAVLLRLETDRDGSRDLRHASLWAPHELDLAVRVGQIMEKALK